ncbi:MAG: phosphatidylinositol-specific phospholipase C/glycerophosphodiester phosphodiesterase family protein [Nocardioidaceae bacterium]
MSPRPTSLPKSLGELFATVIAALVLLASSISAANSGQPSQVTPLAQAHAHNDYEHDQPLMGALDRGFTSVETDVWLVGGELFVGHDRDGVVPGETLETLYLEPLAERVRANGGSVYPGWEQGFHLLIDVKSDARPTYLAIHRTLRRYQAMMTRFSPEGVRGGAVTATISGNRDLGLMAQQNVRYAAYDGRLSDLGSGVTPSLVPLISDSWAETFSWRGVGPMPDSERRKLRDIVAQAHANGQRVRFWATSDLPIPARRSIRQEQLDAGVDYLDTDHPADLRHFLLNNDTTPSTPLVDWWGPAQEHRAR